MSSPPNTTQECICSNVSQQSELNLHERNMEADNFSRGSEVHAFIRQLSFEQVPPIERFRPHSHRGYQCCPMQGPCIPTRGCTDVPFIPVQAIPLVSFGTHRLHGHNCCYQFDIHVGAGACYWTFTVCSQAKDSHPHGCLIGSSGCVCAASVSQ